MGKRIRIVVVEPIKLLDCGARHLLQVYASSGVGRVCKLFYEKEIVVFKFGDGDRECLAPDTIKYKFKLFRVFFCLLLIV